VITWTWLAVLGLIGILGGPILCWVDSLVTGRHGSKPSLAKRPTTELIHGRLTERSWSRLGWRLHFLLVVAVRLLPPSERD
jgi:hypothetical protein